MTTAASLTSHEVARLIQVSPSTVLAWIDKGLLPAYRTVGGHRRVESEHLVSFLRAHEMPVPRSLTRVRRLLVIDDEERFLSTAKRLLERELENVEVATALGPIEGLLRVGSVCPDAVLLDAMMPGIDGVEVCRRLRNAPETAHVLVVALTGNPSPELAEEFLAAGAIACLRKPINVARVRDVLDLNRGEEATL